MKRVCLLIILLLLLGDLGNETDALRSGFINFKVVENPGAKSKMRISNGDLITARSFFQNSLNLKKSRKSGKIKKAPIKSSKIVKKQLIVAKIEKKVIPPVDKVKVIPQTAAALGVKGYHEAVYIGPDKPDHWPQPVIVVLHGTNGRPEWGCNTWKKAGGFYGWILCPRGFPMRGRDNRWTFHGYGSLREEVENSLQSLELQYPGKVTRENMVLAGFSLGAVLIPKFASMAKGKFPYLFLTEGQDELLDYPRIRFLAHHGIKGIVIAIGKEWKQAEARNIVKVFRNNGVNSYYLYMRGAGHHYSKDFDVVGKRALKSILNYDRKPKDKQNGRKTKKKHNHGTH